MINNFQEYLTLENIFLASNWGVIPFWLLILFSPNGNLSRFLVHSILIPFLLGSAYPTAKLGINASMPPILFGAIRMLIVFICLVPFLNFKLPNKKYLLPLLGFSFSMGVSVNLFLYLSVEASSIISPLVIGAQLSIPIAIILSSIFIGESIGNRKWILIITSFF